MNNIVPIKEKLKFSDIFADNKVKQIAWGEDFLAWPIERQLEYAKKLASAMNQAADEMQNDRNRVLKELNTAIIKRTEAEQAAQIAKDTLQNIVTRTNATIQDLQREVQLLQAELKEAHRV